MGWIVTFFLWSTISFWVLVAYTISEIGKKEYTPPPGPFWLPLIGRLWKLGKDQFNGSVKLVKQYGDAISIDFGSRKWVIVNTPQLIKEISTNEHLQGRPLNMETWRTKYRLHDDIVPGGLFQSEKRIHPETAKWVADTLKNWTSEKTEPVILKEVERILKFLHLREKEGRHCQSTDLFEPHAANIIWAVLSGRKLPLWGTRYSAAKVVDGLFGVKFYPKIWRPIWLKEIPKHLQTFPGISIPYFHFPWLIKIFPRTSGYLAFNEDFEKLTQIVKDVVDNHKNDRCPGERAEEKDFIDLYLDEIDKGIKDELSIFYKDFGEFNLISTVGDFVIGGVDPLCATLNWVLAIAVPWYRDSVIMDRLCKELDIVVGKAEYVKLEHRPRMVYMCAFLREVQRFRPVLPWSFPRRATEDTKIGKFTVPQNTHVIANNYAVSRDPVLFPDDPDEFRPERFLSEDGENLLPLPYELQPLAPGCKLCPGDELFQDELFLIVANIMNRFFIFPDSGPTIPPLDPQARFIAAPQPFTFQLVPRYPYGR